MPLNARLEVRLAEHEKVIWGAAAAEAGLTLSEWLRSLANERFAAQAQVAVPVTTHTDAPPAVSVPTPAPARALPPDTAAVGRPHYDRLCPLCAREGVPRCALCKFLNRVPD